MRNLAQRWLFGVSMGVIVLSITALSFYKIAIANAYRTFPDLPSVNETWLGDHALEQLTDVKHAERGRWLMSVIGCRDCHGAQLQGVTLVESREWRVSAPALVGAQARATQFTPDQWRLALRLGIDDERRGLWGMPRRALLSLRDEDVSSLIAAVRTAPLPDQAPPELPHSRLFPWGYWAVTTRSLWPLDRDDVAARSAWSAAPPGEDDAELGDYMAGLSHCTSCHAAPDAPRYSSVWDERQGPALAAMLGPETEHGDARQTRWQAHRCATRASSDVTGAPSIHRASLFTRRQQDALFLSLRRQGAIGDAP